MGQRSAHTISKRGQRPGLVMMVVVEGGGVVSQPRGKRNEQSFQQRSFNPPEYPLLSSSCFQIHGMARCPDIILDMFHMFPHHCLSSCFGFVIVNPYGNTCFFWFVSVVRFG